MAFPPYVPDHTITGGAAAAFTSLGEIERLLSYKGWKLHVDDLVIADENYLPGTCSDATDSNFLSEVIQRVTSRIMEYLAPRFTPQALYQLPRIREIATYWACHDISRRRGNEPLYETEYADGIETLERYREGTLFLNAISSGPRAYVQSYVTDSRFYRNPTRVLSYASTSTVSGQFLSPNYPFFWL